MKFRRILIFVFAALLAFGTAFAVPPGKTVEFAGGDKGKVIFEGKVHADKGFKCADCHTNPKLFTMKKGADAITMDDIKAGKFCGTCHDGGKAFKASDPANCDRCHKK